MFWRLIDPGNTGSLYESTNSLEFRYRLNADKRGGVLSPSNFPTSASALLAKMGLALLRFPDRSVIASGSHVKKQFAELVQNWRALIAFRSSSASVVSMTIELSIEATWLLAKVTLDPPDFKLCSLMNRGFISR